jgi:hypothetical protein
LAGHDVVRRAPAYDTLDIREESQVSEVSMRDVRPTNDSEALAAAACPDGRSRSVRRPRSGELLVVAGLGVLLTLALGVRNGEFNLVFYLLRGTHEADASALRNDWFTEDTTSFHVVWNAVVEWAVRYHALSLVLTLGAISCAIVVVGALYAIAMALYERPMLPCFATIVLLAGSYTRSVGDFYLLPPTLEPFGVGGAFLLSGLAALGWRRPLLAGAAFGLCAFWHLQLGALAAGALIGASVWAARDLGRRGLIELWVPYLVLGLPNIVFAIRLTRSDGADEAIEILRAVAPQQYEPWSTDHDLLLAFAASCLFGIAGLALRRPPMSRPLQGALLATAGSVVLALALGAAFDADLVSRALPWRLASLIMTLAFLFGSAAFFGSRPILSRRASPDLILLTVMGASIVCVGLLGPSRMKLGVFVVLAAAGVAESRHWHPSSARLVRPITHGLLALGLLAMVGSGLEQSHVNLQDPDADRAAVYRFAEETPPGTVFAVPLDFSDFRLLTQRAIVVDWSAPPLRNAEILEWRDRLLAVSGSDHLGTLEELEEGYERPDCERIEQLVEDYEVTYMVTRRRLALECLEVAITTDAFTVSRISD